VTIRAIPGFAAALAAVMTSGCAVGYRFGGGASIDTNQSAGAYALAGGHVGIALDSSRTSDLEAGGELSTGVRSTPLRASVGFDERASFRTFAPSNEPKVSVLVSLYGGLRGLFGDGIHGEGHGGLGIAVSPIVGGQGSGPYMVGIELQGGFVRLLDDQAPPFAGEFALRIYYEFAGIFGPQ
jgi:hypothetical protein